MEILSGKHNLRLNWPFSRHICVDLFFGCPRHSIGCERERRAKRDSTACWLFSRKENQWTCWVLEWKLNMLTENWATTRRRGMYSEQISAGGMFHQWQKNCKKFFCIGYRWESAHHRSLVAFDVLLYAEWFYVDGRGDEREMATEKLKRSTTLTLLWKLELCCL